MNTLVAAPPRTTLRRLWPVLLALTSCLAGPESESAPGVERSTAAVLGTVLDPFPTFPPPTQPDLPPPSTATQNNEDACYPFSTGEFGAMPPLPTAPLGTLTGNFEVTAAGEAHYSVPIQLPPGKAGVQPSLAFEYSSGAGNGPLGMGWQVSGLGSVSRCPKTIAIDGFRSPIKHDNSDAYCLDGQRLIEVGRSTINNTLTVSYRTEAESFTRVSALFYPATAPQPLNFTAHTKAGEVMRYGGEANARVTTPAGVTVTWYLDRVSDRSTVGTSWSVSYLKTVASDDAAHVEHHPSTITYNGNLTVRFVYESADRPDEERRTRAGVQLVEKHRLQQLVISSCAHVWRTYKLTYQTAAATGRSRLTSLQECGTDAVSNAEVCKPASRFEWSTGAAEWSAPIDTGATSVAPQFTINKGASDDGQRGTDHETQPFFTPLAVDLNGDGVSEIVEALGYETADNGRSNFRMRITNFDPQSGAPSPREVNVVSFATRAALEFGGACRDPAAPPLARRRSAAAAASGNYSAGGSYADRLMPLDYDADGLVDLLVLDPTTTWTVLRQSANGDFTARDTGIARSCPNNRGVEPVMFADLDGDGMKDLVECKRGAPVVGPTGITAGPWSWWWRRGTPTGFSSAIHDTGRGHACDRSYVAVADYDGDGTENLLFNLEDSNDLHHVFALILDDTQQFRTEYVGIDRDPAANWSNTTEHWTDVNGDGLVDLLDDVNSVVVDDTGYGILQSMNLYENRGRTTLFPEVAGQVLPFSGRNLFATDGWSVTGFENGPDTTGGRFDVIIDANHDGRADLLTFSNVAGDDHRPFFLTFITNASATRMSTDKIRQRSERPMLNMVYRPLVADLNGDGLSDLLMVDATAGWQLRLAKGRRPDLLVAIRDGLSGNGAPSISLGYEPLTSRTIPDLYRPGVCTYPQSCGVVPMPVVVGVNYDSTGTDSRSYSYRYEDLRTDLRGRGLLGFRKVIRSRSAKNETLTLTFDNGVDLSGAPSDEPTQKAYPFAGVLLQSELKTVVGTRTIVDTTVTTPVAIWLDAAMNPVAPQQSVTHFVSPQRVVHTRREDSRQLQYAETLSVTNAFGDVEVRQTLGSDGRTDVQTNVYDNDLSKWLLGLPRRTTETSTAMVAGVNVSQSRSVERTFEPTTGFLVSETLDPELPSLRLVRTWARDLLGNPTRYTEQAPTGAPRVTTFGYDALQQFVKTTTNALGQTTFTQFDRGTGLKVAEKSPDGAVTRWTYDAFGRLALEAFPTGLQVRSQLSLDAETGDMVLNVVGSDDRRRLERFDRLGRMIELTTCGSGSSRSTGSFVCKRVVQSSTYDADGRLREQTVPFFADTPPAVIPTTRWQYDTLGRETLRTLPDGNTVRTAYDGTATETTNPRGLLTRVERDSRGRVWKTRDPNLARSTRTYGPFDTLMRVEITETATATPLVTTMTYDHHDRRLSLEDPDLRQWTTYDAYGQVVSEQTPSQRADGMSTTFTYDALGRMKTRTERDGSTPTVTTWTWDDANGFGQPGKLATVTTTGPDATVATRFRYAPLTGLLIERQQATGADAVAHRNLLTIKYEYDSAGRVRFTTYPDNTGVAASADDCASLRQFKTETTYNAAGDLEKIRDACAPTAAPYFQLINLDAAGRPTLEVRGGQPASTMLGVWRSWDDRGRLTRLTATQVLTPFFDVKYQYDGAGNVKVRDELSPGALRTEAFAYDEVERLTSVSVTSGAGFASTIGYSPSGNIVRKDGVFYEYGATWPRHGVTALHSTSLSGPVLHSFSYDLDGHVTTPWGGGKIEWSVFGKPRRLVDGSTSVSFLYDHERTRVQKAGTQTGTTVYAGGLYERTKKVSGLNTLWIHRYFIEAYGSTVAQISRLQLNGGAVSESRNYFVADPVGTSSVVFDGTGTVLDRRQYDAFGQLRASSGSTPVVTRGFGGLEYDGPESSELINMNERMYDPRLGRMLTADPMISAPKTTQDFNRFSYAWNNPLRVIDPSGLAETDLEMCVEPTIEATPAPEVTPAISPAVKSFDDGVTDPGSISAMSDTEVKVMKILDRTPAVEQLYARLFSPKAYELDEPQGPMLDTLQGYENAVRAHVMAANAPPPAPAGAGGPVENLSVVPAESVQSVTSGSGASAVRAPTAPAGLLTALQLRLGNVGRALAYVLTIKTADSDFVEAEQARRTRAEAAEALVVPTISGGPPPPPPRIPRALRPAITPRTPRPAPR